MCDEVCNTSTDDVGDETAARENSEEDFSKEGLWDEDDDIEEERGRRSEEEYSENCLQI